jgi:transcription initiation factor TFIID subunit 2
MPCVDSPNAACSYDIHITVAKDQMAVASGQLLGQVWAAQHRKRFHFSLPHMTAAAHIAFAVGGPHLILSTGLTMRTMLAAC